MSSSSDAAAERARLVANSDGGDGGGDGAKDRGTACRGCLQSRSDRSSARLIAYSAFTKRVNGRADRLLLACKEKAMQQQPEEDGRASLPSWPSSSWPSSWTPTTIVEIARVPYRFYVPHSSAVHVDADRLKKETSQCGGFALERCRAIVDLATSTTSDARRRGTVVEKRRRGTPRDLLKVTCFNREAYRAAYERAAASLRHAGLESPFTDCCHNFCHGSEALVNCGIPGAVGAISVRDAPGGGGRVERRGEEEKKEERKKEEEERRRPIARTVTVETPSQLCCHDPEKFEERFDRTYRDWLIRTLRVGAILASSRPSSFSRSKSWSIRVATRATATGDAESDRNDAPIEERLFESSDPGAASKALQALRDASFDALFVFDLKSTLDALRELAGDPCAAGSKSWFVFSKRKDCRPWTADNGVFGLGVLVFDLRSKWNARGTETAPGELRKPPETAARLLELAASCRALSQHLANVSKSRTNSCVVHEKENRGSGFGPSPFDAFSCTMALTYQSRGMVTARRVDDVTAPYRGGCIVRPEAGFYADVAVDMDFFAMYPSILLLLNMSKETYLCPPKLPLPQSSCLAAADDANDPRERRRARENGKARWFFDLGELGGFEGHVVDHRAAETTDANANAMRRAIAADVRKREALLLESSARGSTDATAAADASASAATTVDVEEAAACKKFVNATYGMLGNPDNPYADRRVAACVTATGRRLLAACCESLALAENTAESKPVPPIAFRLLATHTDSLLVRCLDDAADDDDGSGKVESTSIDDRVREAVESLSRRFRRAIFEELKKTVAVTSSTSRARAKETIDAVVCQRSQRLRIVPKSASVLGLLAGKATKQYRLLRTVTGGVVTASLEKKNAGRSATSSSGAGHLEAPGIFEEAVIEMLAMRGRFLVQASSSSSSSSFLFFSSFQVWDAEKLIANLPIRAFLSSCGGWKRIVSGTVRSSRGGGGSGESRDATATKLEPGIETVELTYRDDDDDDDRDTASRGASLTDTAIRRCIRCSDDGLLADAGPFAATTRVEKNRTLEERRRATVEGTRLFLAAFAKGEFPLHWYAKGGDVRVESGKWVPLETAARAGARVDLRTAARLLTARILDRVQCSLCSSDFTTQRPLYLIEARRGKNGDGETATTTATTTATGRRDTEELARCEASRGTLQVELRHSECLREGDRSIAGGERERWQDCWVRTAMPRAEFLTAAILSGCDTLSEVRQRVDALRELGEFAEKTAVEAGDGPRSAHAVPFSYEVAVDALRREAREDPTADMSVSERFDGATVACLPLPDNSGRFLALTRSHRERPLSPRVCDRLHAAICAFGRRGRRFDDGELLEACRAYPVHRLRVCPPPVLLTKDYRAPLPTWQEAMVDASARARDSGSVGSGRRRGGGNTRRRELARASTDDDDDDDAAATPPKKPRAKVVYCRFCGAALHADCRRHPHGCGEGSTESIAFACTACCLRETRCPDCDEPFAERREREGDDHRSPSPTIDYAAFPFSASYERTGNGDYAAFCGPDRLAYDDSFRRIVRLSRGRRR